MSPTFLTITAAAFLLSLNSAAHSSVVSAGTSTAASPSSRETSPSLPRPDCFGQGVLFQRIFAQTASLASSCGAPAAQAQHPIG